MQRTLSQAFLDADAALAQGIVRERLEANEDPVGIIEDCRRAITDVGDRFGRGELYLSELIMAGDMFQKCVALIEPHLTAGSAGPVFGKIVLGTVQGDIHDLGKNIVAVLLRCSGFEVIDLGVDVPPQRFVEAVMASGATILGMSCLLTTAFDAMKTTVQSIDRAGLRDKVWIVIGGGPVDDRVAGYVGADRSVHDAVEGVRACRDRVQHS